MKKLLLALITLASFSYESAASHAAGGSIWYEYIGDSTGIPYHYMINMELLRRNETGSVTLNSTYQISLTSSCYANQSIPVQRVIPPANMAAGDGGFLPDPQKKCSNGSSNDPNWINISIHRYVGSVILPGTCSDYVFSYSLCCLNSNITNLQTPELYNIYLDSRLNNTKRPNTSPRFEASPILSYCINKSATTYYSAVEPDGDSLFYALAQPWNADNVPIPYIDSTFSVKQPITTLHGVSFDSIYGMMSFIPTTIENDVVKVKVREFRYDSLLHAYHFVGVTSLQVQYQIVSTCDTASVSWSFSQNAAGIDTTINPICMDSVIKFKTDFSFLKSSLAADGSDFRLIDVAAGNVPIPIIGASTNDNSTSLFANEIHLHLHQPIYHDGEYRIVSEVGSDTNTVISICNVAIPSKDTVSFMVSDCQSGFGIDENKVNALKIYPSPATNYVMIQLPLNETLSNWSYKIYNLQSQVLLQDEFAQNTKGAQNIDVNTLPEGFYTLQLFDDNGNAFSGKFVKK